MIPMFGRIPLIARLTDIFSVESEVAKAIAEQLRAQLTGREEQVIAAKPTDNVEAYDAYLRGLAYTLKRLNTTANYLDAQKYLREAVRWTRNSRLAGRCCRTWMRVGYRIRELFNQQLLCAKRHDRQPKPRSVFSPISERPYWPRAITTTPA